MTLTAMGGGMKAAAGEVRPSSARDAKNHNLFETRRLILRITNFPLLDRGDSVNPLTA